MLIINRMLSCIVVDANKFIVIVIIIDIVLGVNGPFNSNIGITGIPILAYKWPFSSNFGTDIILVKVVLEMELFVKGTELGIFPETVFARYFLSHLTCTHS